MSRFLRRRSQNWRCRLADIGIDVMDVAFPITSHSDRAGAPADSSLRGQQGRIRSDAFRHPGDVPCPAADLDCVLEVVAQAGGRPSRRLGADSVDALGPSPQYKLGRALLKPKPRRIPAWLDTPISFYRVANIRLITDAIRYARSRGFERIEFAAEDASRSTPGYTIEWAEACIAAGGTRVRFSDTCGVFTPEGVDHYFPRLVETLGVPPRPLPADRALSQRFRARRLQHGSRRPARCDAPERDRERHRRTCRQYVAAPVRHGPERAIRRYAAAIPLRTTPVCAMLSKGIRHPGAGEPIIGEGVFSHESGIHTAAILVHPAIYQFIREDTVGGATRFVFGKHSGTAARSTGPFSNTTRPRSPPTGRRGQRRAGHEHAGTGQGAPRAR